MGNLQPFTLIPEYRDYPWGGDRLRPGQSPTAEAWIVYEQDRIASGPLAGITLAEAAETYGAELLGERPVQRTGRRFPLLIKLLDSAQWLSLQVHPNDQQAKQFEGPGQFGKTEAWVMLETSANAQLIAGVKPGVPAEILASAIGERTILELVSFHSVQAGDTVSVPAGTIHAIGPSLLIYEVQQTSDLTYRIYDWDRPQTGGRTLHVEKARAVVNPAAEVRLVRPSGEPRQVLAHSLYFTLERIRSDGQAVELDPGGQTFHALTILQGQVQIEAASGRLDLEPRASAIVPAAAGRYRTRASGPFELLKASVEAG